MSEASAVEDTGGGGVVDPQEGGNPPPQPDDTVVEPEEVKKNPTLLRWAARKENEFRKAQEKIDSQRQEFSKLQEAAGRLQQLESLLQESPEKVLSHYGVQLEDIAKRQESQNDPQQALLGQIQQMIAPIQESIQELSEFRSEITAERQKEVETTLNDGFSQRIGEILESEGKDKYPALLSFGERGKALALMQVQKARAENREIGEAEAMGEVEQELQPIMDEAVENYLKLRKAAVPKEEPVTISNDLRSAVPNMPKEGNHKIPHYERVNRLVQRTQVPR